LGYAVDQSGLLEVHTELGLEEVLLSVADGGCGLCSRLEVEDVACSLVTSGVLRVERDLRSSHYLGINLTVFSRSALEGPRAIEAVVLIPLNYYTFHELL